MGRQSLTKVKAPGPKKYLEERNWVELREDAKTWFRSNQDALANPRIVSWDDLKREMRKQFSSTRMRHGRVEKLCIDWVRA